MKVLTCHVQFSFCLFIIMSICNTRVIYSSNFVERIKNAILKMFAILVLQHDSLRDSLRDSFILHLSLGQMLTKLDFILMTESMYS